MRYVSQLLDAQDGPELAPGEILVALTRNELASLRAALDEAQAAVDDWEFDTRVGLTPDEANSLILAMTTAIYDAGDVPQT